MPMYWGDYIKKTARFTLAHHGAYMLLIAEYWTSGRPLPADPEEQAIIARVSTKEWLKLRPKIAEKFDERDGLWHHERIDKELATAAARTAAKSKAGAAGAAKRWHAHATANGTAMADASFRQCRTDAQSQSQSPKDISVSDDTAGPKYEFGKIFDEQFWPAYPSRGQAQNPKKPARLKFVAACNRGEDPLAIVAAVKAYAANPTTKVGTEFVKTAEVWLSKECWKDQAPAPKAIADVDVPKGWSEEDARWFVRLRKGASYWPQNVWGPRDINHPDCRIPKHVYEHWVASTPVGPMVPATQQILRRA